MPYQSLARTIAGSVSSSKKIPVLFGALKSNLILQYLHYVS
jgi:hypothetical protein